MVDGIGRSDLARAAIEAALRSQSQQSQRIDAQVAKNLAPAVEAPKPGFESALGELVSNAAAATRTVDELPLDMVSGKLGDLHEVVGRLKQSELTFKFALEVRNKLIDAYRETMRMSV
jgi:flagellar hook-basal body complex protein FliE